MDPITALALACNVTQLVEQAIEAASVCKEIYERGSLDENNKIEEYAEGIAAANRDLETTLKAQKTTPSSRPTRLQRIVDDSVATTAELRKVLNQLKLSKKQGNKQTSNAFKTSLKAVFKKGTVESLRKKLEQQDAALRSALLKDLYIKAGQDDLTRRSEFKTLSDSQKDAIKQVLGSLQIVSKDIATSIKASEIVLAARLSSQDAQLEQSMRLLSTDIPATVKGAEARLLDRFNDQDSLLKDTAQQQNVQTKYLLDQAHDALRTRLLDALAFPEMNERRNMIEGRIVDFGETYGWIFNPPDSDEGLSHGGGSHTFVEWLRTGQEVFWINGKPGSGKSSLMDYIYQNLWPDGRGFVHLEAWANPRPIRLLSFWFFRPASSPLLKSLDGFWRSLCFQILDTDKDIVTKIRTNVDHSAPHSLRACLIKSGSHAQSWTNMELKSWLCYLLDHSAFNYCLLVDGLDEVPNDSQAVLDAIRVIAQSSSKIKICCSSRPEALFMHSLQHYPSLRLQDFNYDDIMAHCSERLSATRAAPFAQDIAVQADGVFLWAYLVVEELRTAAVQGDDQDDLKRRFEECPSEMNDLFMFLLERQDKFYAKHPKPYLRLIDVGTRHRTTPSLLEVLIASQEQARLTCNFPDNLDAQFLESLNAVADNFEANATARCAGLVEFRKSDPGPNGPGFPETFPHKALVRLHGLVAHFIHRSAQDFLVDSERGATLLQSCNISEQEALQRLLTATSVIFLLNDHDKNSMRVGDFAVHKDRASWTDFDSVVLDHTLAMFQKRTLPTLPPSLSEDKDENFRLATHQYTPPKLCPRLSPFKNVVFAYAIKWALTGYLKAKLSVLEKEELTVVAGYCACELLDHTFYDELYDDVLAILVPHLSWTQNVTICYLWDVGPCYVHVNLPFWQHIGWHKGIRAFGDDAFGVSQRRLKALEGLGACSTGKVLCLRAWLVPSRDVLWGPSWKIYAETDETITLAVNTLAETLDIFKVQITLQADDYSVQFCQYSPRGLDRFYEIDAATSKALQLKHPIGAQDVPLLEMADILNHHIGSLSGAGIAKILRSSRGDYIFSKGRFRPVDEFERREWEKRLQSEIFDEDFEAGPELDPVLDEIMKMLRTTPD